MVVSLPPPSMRSVPFQIAAESHSVAPDTYGAVMRYFHTGPAARSFWSKA